MAGAAQHINASKCTPILGSGITESLIGPRREIARRWAKTYWFPLAAHDQDDLPQVAQFVYVNQKDRHFSWTNFAIPCGRDFFAVGK